MTWGDWGSKRERGHKEVFVDFWLKKVCHEAIIFEGQLRRHWNERLVYIGDAGPAWFVNLSQCYRRYSCEGSQGVSFIPSFAREATKFAVQWDVLSSCDSGMLSLLCELEMLWSCVIHTFVSGFQNDAHPKSERFWVSSTRRVMRKILLFVFSNPHRHIPRKRLSTFHKI